MVDSEKDTKAITRAKKKHSEQETQAIRQTKQGLRQDQQGLRQDHGQEQQEATDQITKEHTEQLLEVKSKQEKSDENLFRIIDGVDVLSKQVKTLNERVYSKNYLDKIRNGLILGFMISFLIVSGFLGMLLHSQKVSSEDRATEARLARRQLADCTVRPGIVIENGYINPGLCYTESAKRTGEAVSKITTDVVEAIKPLLSSPPS